MKVSREDHFFIYPKDPKGKRTGHCICVVLRDGSMYEGTALCSVNDNFSRKEGRKLAFQRAIAAYEKVSGNLSFEVNPYNESK